MTIAQSPKPAPTPAEIQLPDHTQLPESDGTFVKNFQEHPQSLLLTDSIRPILQKLHPDGRYAIGQDSGIYWRLTDPPERGAEAPDWFYVPNVSPTLKGKIRRSYVLWKEYIAPQIVLEFVSGDGTEERDRTAPSADEDAAIKPGKFWVYEQAIRVPFYGIYDVKNATIEVYQLVLGRYQPLLPNLRGHYEIPAMDVALGRWEGCYGEYTEPLPWLRWWSREGELLLTGEERAEQEKQRAEQEKQRAEQEKQRAEQEKQRAEQEKQRAEQEKQRAEQEKQRADRYAEQLRQMGINLEEL
jgi:Uma2 family endonuclease